MIENTWKPLGQAGQTDREGRATQQQVDRTNDAIWWHAVRQRQAQVAETQGKQQKVGKKP